MWPIWHTKRHSKFGPSSPMKNARPPPRCSSCGKTESVVYWSRVALNANPTNINRLPIIKTEDDDDDDDNSSSTSDADLYSGALVCNECRAASTSHGTSGLSNTDKPSLNSGGIGGNVNLPVVGDDGIPQQSLNVTLDNVDENGGNGTVLLRKSRRTAASTSKTVTQQPVKFVAPKGKSRRTIFKKSATKAPAAVATVVTTGSVFQRGMYYQVGDVVSMIDVKGGVYYAQIRGLLQDQYCHKSAVITWLLPTETSPDPDSGFDPNTYIIGPEEDIPRKLDCMDFVCHAPSEYFKAKNSPYQTVEQTKPELGFIWTRLKPQIRRVHDKRDSIFETG